MSSGACVIGVDLGGTKLIAGAVDDELGVHHRAYRAARGADQHAVIDTIVSAVEEARSAAPGPVSAVGFGIPSLIDQVRGVVVTTVHLPIRDLAFRDVMAERLGLPVYVDNDANVALLCEWRHGAARETRDAVMLTLGTGIGGAMVCGGRMIRGSVGAGAELGHMVVDYDGPPCQGDCPNRGCLEAVASGSALDRAAREAAEAWPTSGLGLALASGADVSGPLVTELAHDGDPVAGEVLARIGAFLGVGIANLVNIFNPEVVVVGGGVIAAGDLLLEPARAEMKARALAPSRDLVKIVAARFGAESGMLGAAVLAMEGER